MKIKTCPFCGSAPQTYCLLEGSLFEAHYIKCSNEKCEAEIKYPHSTKQEAIDAWNTRLRTKFVELIKEQSTINEIPKSTKQL